MGPVSGAGPDERLARLLVEIDALTPGQVETLVRLGPAIIADPDCQGVVTASGRQWATLRRGARLLDVTLLVERRAAVRPALAPRAPDEQWMVLEAVRDASSDTPTARDAPPS